LDHPGRESRGEINKETFMSKNGPFWYRGYLEENHEYKHMTDEELTEILSLFKVRRIFVGHTNVKKITPLYQSRVFALDVPFYSNGVEIQGIIISNGILFRANSSGIRNEIR
jgi:hypothetical protein